MRDARDGGKEMRDADARCEMKERRYGMRDAGCEMRDARCGMRDAGCEMRDARLRNLLQDVECGMSELGCGFQGTGYGLRQEDLGMQVKEK